ncbi:MAG: hypothetical protein AB8F95_05740 [Bacteroidia bacterium]
MLLILLSPALSYAQIDDKRALLDFFVPLQVLTDTDEGSQKDDSYRLKKIGWYSNAETPFVALPSSVSASVICDSGDCMNGIGAVRYPAIGASYLGTFKDGYPHERGQITNAAGVNMVVTHYEGLLSGPAALKLTNDTIREYLYLEYQTGDLAKVKNYYFPDLKLYYTGLFDDFKPYREGTLFGSGVEAETQFNDDGVITSAVGKLLYQKGVYYEGKLQWKNGCFNFAERGTLHNENNGTRIDMTFLDNGKPRLQQMSIWKGDTLYVGPVDENFLPHGERGRLDINRETVKRGVWEHGVYQGKYGRQPATTSTFATNTESGRNNRAFMIKAIKDKLGINGFRKYTLYEGSPAGNTFSIDIDGMNEQYIGIWIINFSEGSQKVCIKAQFAGGSSRKTCYDMTPLAKQASDGSFDFDDDGVASLPFNLPSDEGTFRFDITEGNGRDLYILVFPR